ncbi:Ribonucleotide reductase of class Ia (aerobic), alpha subunit [hydrothermal vent metagenome]|uniref:ribonucleoside-diphosphate reductase n=1 Tax=hydrothermal vent metagenome TaxID=652676 RepID=A0A3B1DK85_9ZZZZ
MPQESMIVKDMKVQKRNGQIVAFNELRIKKAIGNAFKETNNLPREAELPIETSQSVIKVAQSVFSVLQERFIQKEHLTVEEIQDEVIRQLFENGFKEGAELYANYRKQHAAKRKLFELYSIMKRGGKNVSFKPEKITEAIAKAFRANNSGILTEDLLVKARKVANQVIEEIQALWPEGKSVNIEEIQDLVEQNLMKAGYHDVARNYIIYREKHARDRREKKAKQQESVSYDWVKGFVYKTSAGEERVLNLDEIRFQIDTCCQGLENVSADKILEESTKNYFNGMTEKEIIASNIMAAKAFLEQQPDYTFVAARLLLIKEYEEAIGRSVSFEGMRTEYATYFASYIHKAVELELLTPDLLQFDLKKLGNHINPKRDFLFRYMGLQTLYDRYFIHWEEKRLELPQIFWMRVAMGLAKREGSKKNEKAIEFYNVLSTFRFMSSTPTLFNSGTLHSQLSSCFLTTINDDLSHIFKCIGDDAMLSKWSGGLGNDWTNVRAMGSRIKGTNGKSQGIIPFLKVANDTALAVNQGGKRQGAMCAYLEVWHLDIEEFLELRKNTGDDRRRTHDMHTANWIPDLFMKRVKENADWTLFSPNEAPDLHHIYGKEFERRYAIYETMAKEGKLKQHKTMPAITLWRKMLNMLFETGHPWITWKDPSNIRSAQDHIGAVHSSNLCTEILLNTSEDETAVCNLGSVNLAAHTAVEGINHELLKKTIQTAIRMLDNVIDNNYYPTVEAKNANKKHRPIGIGLMGFQDALFIQNKSYASQEAVEFADKSMEAISYYTILASINLAKEKGVYSSYRGSKWDKGILPIDTIDLLEKERGGFLDMDRSSKMDWAFIRKELKKHGMRNSQVMSIAPTATIGNIVGVTASIEPLFKNIFVKSNLSGEFTVLNEFLVQDLKALGLWNEEMIDDLKYFDGSVQEIERIPDEIKTKYTTAFEIEYEWLIEAGSRRQKWIDMGQSLNLYQAKPNGKKVSDMYLFGWEKGLKTTYYLRSMGATRIEKSTVDITKRENVVGRRERDKFGRVTGDSKPVSRLSVEPTEECEACQ